MEEGNAGHGWLEVLGTAVGNTKCLRPAICGIPLSVYDAPVNLKLDFLMTQETQI